MGSSHFVRAKDCEIWHMGIMKTAFMDIPQGFHVCVRRIRLKGGDLFGGPCYIVFHTRSNQGFRAFGPFLEETVRLLGEHPNQDGVEGQYRTWLADHPLPRRERIQPQDVLPHRLPARTAM